MKVQVLSPESLVFESEEADEVFLPGGGGDMVVMADHTPLLSSLRIGAIEVRTAGATRSIAVAGGFFEASPEAVRIIADAAELAESIDVSRAKQAQARAEERLRNVSAKGVEVDVERARAALQRALNRLEVASRRKEA